MQKIRVVFLGENDIDVLDGRVEFGVARSYEDIEADEGDIKYEVDELWVDPPDDVDPFGRSFCFVFDDSDGGDVERLNPDDRDKMVAIVVKRESYNPSTPWHLSGRREDYANSGVAVSEIVESNVGWYQCTVLTIETDLEWEYILFRVGEFGEWGQWEDDEFLPPEEPYLDTFALQVTAKGLGELTCGLVCPEATKSIPAEWVTPKVIDRRRDFQLLYTGFDFRCEYTPLTRDQHEARGQHSGVYAVKISRSWFTFWRYNCRHLDLNRGLVPIEYTGHRVSLIHFDESWWKSFGKAQVESFPDWCIGRRPFLG